MTGHGSPLDWTLDPLDALRRWPAETPLAMLHSGRLDPAWSRWSMLAEPVGALVYQYGRSERIGDMPGNGELTHDPFRDLEAVTTSGDALWIGYLGYDLGRVIERLDRPPPLDRDWPDLQFQRCPGWLTHDRLTGRWSAHGTWAAGRHPPLDRLTPVPDAFTTGEALPGVTRDQHEAAVRRALNYIAAGDVFQVNLAQRFTAPFAGSTRGLYQRLAAASPAWYGAYVELLQPAAEHRLEACATEEGRPSPSPSQVEGGKKASRALCSTSPELFLRLDPDGRVVTRPIKGTRPATAPPEELERSAKDAAELNMIVDLLRNDLGRVCDYGSVRVTQPRTVESHPTVHHGVATVEGRLHPSRSLRHLLRATFPGGSVTGAAKVRAMQIIDELEPVQRGPYCGAIGYVLPQPGSPYPEAQFNLAIRTMLADPAPGNPGNGRVDFSVGGGIVADSVPADEYEETLHKAAAMLHALRPQTV